MNLKLAWMIFFTSIWPCWAQNPALSWHTEESTAREAAKKEGKAIFIFFTAEWCHFCHTMEKETLNVPELSEYLTQHFILLKCDYDQSKDLVARFRVRGVPAMIVADSELKAIDQTTGFMAKDAFLAWIKLAAAKGSPEAIAAEKLATEEFTKATIRSFREGLLEGQYAAINAFYEKCARKEPRTLEFARIHLPEEIKHNPGRFARFLKADQLHARILTGNAFAKLYGEDFEYDPWDLSTAHFARVENFLKTKNISSLLEDLFDYKLNSIKPLPEPSTNLRPGM